MQSTERPPCLPPSRTLAVSVLVAAVLSAPVPPGLLPAAASPDGPEARFILSLEAVRGEPMQSSE